MDKEQCEKFKYMDLLIKTEKMNHQENYKYVISHHF